MGLFVGGQAVSILWCPPVTIWRELRRLNVDGYDGLIAEVARAADKGDWQAFVMLMGGAGACTKEQGIKIFREDKSGVNQYGEPKEQSLVGVKVE